MRGATRVLASAACLLALCGAGGARAEEPPAERHAGAVPDLDCPPPVDGAEGLTGPGAMVLVGELHGTREAPAFFSSLVCAAARRAGPAGVVVGIEMARTDQGALDAFVAAPTPAAARSLLLAAGHFTDPWQDGRDSVAMVALLEDIRRWRASGAPIEVVAFDVAPGPKPRTDREAAMAEALADAASRRPGASVLIYTGNLHSRTLPSPFAPSRTPMGAHLKARFPALRTLDFASAGGTAWLCVMTEGGSGQICGEQRQGGTDRGPQPFVELWDEPDAGGHDGIYYLGPITASPPAVPGPDG